MSPHRRIRHVATSLLTTVLWLAVPLVGTAQDTRDTVPLRGPDSYHVLLELQNMRRAMHANIDDWLQRDALLDEAVSAAYGLEILYGGQEPGRMDLGGTIRQSFLFVRRDGTSGGLFYGGNVVPRLGSTLYLFFELVRPEGFGFALGMLQLELDLFEPETDESISDERAWFDDLYASVSYNGVSIATPAATFRGHGSVVQVSAPTSFLLTDRFGIAPATTMQYEYFPGIGHSLGLEAYRARLSPYTQLDALARLRVFDREGLDLRHGAVATRLSASAVNLRTWHLRVSAGASYVSDLEMNPRFGGMASVGIVFADQAFAYNAPALNLIVARNYEPYYHRMPVVDQTMLWIQYGVHP